MRYAHEPVECPRVVASDIAASGSTIDERGRVVADLARREVVDDGPDERGGCVFCREIFG